MKAQRITQKEAKPWPASVSLLSPLSAHPDSLHVLMMVWEGESAAPPVDKGGEQRSAPWLIHLVSIVPAPPRVRACSPC